jgi:acyl carrier protein
MMSRVEILHKMQLVIQDQMGNKDIVLTEDTKLYDLGVDSIELMEFIINLEDEFALEISDDTIDHMDKVADLLDYLSEQLNNR